MSGRSILSFGRSASLSYAPVFFNRSPKFSLCHWNCSSQIICTTDWVELLTPPYIPPCGIWGSRPAITRHGLFVTILISMQFPFQMLGIFDTFKKVWFKQNTELFWIIICQLQFHLKEYWIPIGKSPVFSCNSCVSLYSTVPHINHETISQWTWL